MSKQYFMPRTQDAYAKWHDAFGGETGALAEVGPSVSVTADEIANVLASNRSLHGKIAAATTADNNAKSTHTELNMSISDTQSEARNLIKRIKLDPGYSPVIGQKLDIIGAEDSTDMTQQKPTLGAEAKSNGVVELPFNKMLAEGMHLYSQRGDEPGYTYLASETHSPYVDNRPLLDPKKPETRRYKAKFFIGKAEIGLESDIVETTAKP